MLSDHYITDRLLTAVHPVINNLGQLTPQILTEPYWNNKKTPLLISSFIGHSSKVNQLPDKPKIPPLNDLPYGITSTHNTNIRPNFYDIKRTATNKLIEQKL